MQDKDLTISRLMWQLAEAMEVITKLKKEIAELKKRKEASKCM